MIRRSLPQDEARLVSVWEQSVAATHDFLAAGDLDVYRPLVRQGLAALEVWVFAEAAAGGVCAFIALQGVQIEMLFVAPGVQGSGVGRKLVAFAKDLCGGNALTVEVNEQNERARRFYQKCGFVHVLGRRALDPLGKPYPILVLGQAAAAG